MSMGLTLMQSKCLAVICAAIDTGQSSPTFDEIGHALDLTSKSSVARLVGALEERGFIKRTPNRARAIEVIKGPCGFFVHPLPEVMRGIEAYAAKNNITITTAAEEALRVYFVDAVAA
jgi:repressor LexA